MSSELDFQWFMMFRNTVFMGRMVFGEQNVEKTVKFALANETDIAYLYGRIKSPRIWHPQSVSMRSILDCDFFAVNVVVHVESILRSREGRKVSIHFENGTRIELLTY
jgi:hypothetical protein